MRFERSSARPRTTSWAIGGFCKVGSRGNAARNGKSCPRAALFHDGRGGMRKPPQERDVWRALRARPGLVPCPLAFAERSKGSVGVLALGALGRRDGKRCFVMLALALVVLSVGGIAGATAGENRARVEAIGGIVRAAAGGVVVYPLPAGDTFGCAAFGCPHGLIVGPDRALWFGEAGGKLGRISLDGKVTDYPLGRPGDNVWNLALGPDGALWFTTADSSAHGGGGGAARGRQRHLVRIAT